MKCYFCLTAPDTDNSVYTDLFEVSIKSARKNTSLDLYVLYDGPTNHRCYDIMKKYNVKIIMSKFSHREYLQTVYPERWLLEKYGKVDSYDKIAGTFMRLDIPFIEKEDEYVFYVDIDVIFMKDISIDDLPKPKYLAAAPEFFKDISAMDYFNAGILLLNVKNMREKCQEIFARMERGERNKINVFDQGYLNEACFASMDLLPLEYNWKPYWGVNDNAKIIHLHGMKPGGNMSNSGFCMSNEVVHRSLVGHIEDIKGYVYYSMLYYDFLGIDGKNWISEFISRASIIMNTTYTSSKKLDDLKKYEKKYKKYKKYFIFCICIITFLIMVVFYDVI